MKTQALGALSEADRDQGPADQRSLRCRDLVVLARRARCLAMWTAQLCRVDRPARRSVTLDGGGSTATGRANGPDTEFCCLAQHVTVDTPGTTTWTS